MLKNPETKRLERKVRELKAEVEREKKLRMRERSKLSEMKDKMKDAFSDEVRLLKSEWQEKEESFI